jgi:hypothetical protein
MKSKVKFTVVLSLIFALVLSSNVFAVYLYCPAGYAKHDMVSQGSATVYDINNNNKVLFNGGLYTCSRCGENFVCEGFPDASPAGPIYHYVTQNGILGGEGVNNNYWINSSASYVQYTTATTLAPYIFRPKY